MSLASGGDQNLCLTRGPCPCSSLSAQLCIWRARGIPGTWRLSTLHRVHLWGLQCWPGLWGDGQRASLWGKLSGSGVWRLRVSTRVWSEHGSAGFWGLGLGAWLWGKRSSSSVWGWGPSAWLWWKLHPYVWHSRWVSDAAQEAAQLLSMNCCSIVLDMTCATCLTTCPGFFPPSLWSATDCSGNAQNDAMFCCAAVDKAASIPATGRMQVPSVCNYSTCNSISTIHPSVRQLHTDPLLPLQVRLLSAVASSLASPSPHRAPPPSPLERSPAGRAGPALEVGCL